MLSTLLQKLLPVVTLAPVRTFLANTAAGYWKWVNKICSDVFANWNGDIDPARLSYLFVWICGTVFLVLTILDFKINRHFDGTMFSTGCVALSVQMIAAAAGVRIKQSSEVPQS